MPENYQYCVLYVFGWMELQRMRFRLFLLFELSSSVFSTHIRGMRETQCVCRLYVYTF